MGLPPSIFWKILTPCEENGYVTMSSLSFYDPILADVENGSGEDLEIVVIDDSEKVSNFYCEGERPVRSEATSWECVINYASNDTRSVLY